MTRAAKLIGTLATCLVPAALPAQHALPDFETCFALEIARFERNLTYHRIGPEAESFEVGTTRGTTFCGTVGITLCDMTEDRAPCQRALAVQQLAIAAQVRDTLPAPDEVVGTAGAESDQFYPVLRDLAHDLSAGNDCAGATPRMAAWCEAREANKRLGSAVLAWQMARFLDAAPDAVSAGWANPPPLTRPRLRDGGE